VPSLHCIHCACTATCSFSFWRRQTSEGQICGREIRERALGTRRWGASKTCVESCRGHCQAVRGEKVQQIAVPFLLALPYFLIGLALLVWPWQYLVPSDSNRKKLYRSVRGTVLGHFPSEMFGVGAMKITTQVQERLICPHCRVRLHSRGESFVCNACGNYYPVIAGIPILIDVSSSAFRIDSYERPRPLSGAERAKRAARDLLPRISLNVAARRNYQKFREMLFNQSSQPRVLIVGGATAGAGMSELLGEQRIEFVESDVAIDERTTLVCDAQNLPFAEETFDGVIIQAVLFYLPEYGQCISEIFRVLKPGGIIYSESPFMEQVVGGAYDFYRFTLRGHEYQFRQFEKLSSGVSGGPAMATAWSIQYLMLSFVQNAALRAATRIFCKCTLFWMKYLDLLLANKPGAVDAAAGTYFMGRRPGEARTDEQPLPVEAQPATTRVPEYRGLIQSDVRAYR